MTPPKVVMLTDALETEIRAGAYLPGAVLPSVRDLRDAWGTSLQSAHDALRLLREWGLVTSGPGRRFVVVDPLPPQVVRVSVEERLAKIEARLDRLEGHPGGV